MLHASEYTREQWLEEVRNFRDLMGSREFWEKAPNPNGAVTGLWYVFLRTKDTTERDTSILYACTDEFTRRAAYAATLTGRKDI